MQNSSELNALNQTENAQKCPSCDNNPNRLAGEHGKNNSHLGHSIFLKPNITPPKYSCDRWLKSPEQRNLYHRLQDKIWSALISSLECPITQTSTEEHRIIEVLGFIRYYIRHSSGEVHSRMRGTHGDDEGLFNHEGGLISIDPPLICNSFMMKQFINQWKNEFIAIDTKLFTDIKGNCCFPYSGPSHLAIQFMQQMSQAFMKAIRQSVYWKRLRYHVTEALALDPELIEIARKARVVRHKNNLSNVHFNKILANQNSYRKLYNDAPNLLWLLTLCLDEGLDIQGSEPLLVLKNLVINEGCQARGWRLLARSQLRDFEAAVEFSGKSWKYLIEYIKLHQVLDRKNAIPKKLTHLFAEPNWQVNNYDEIMYRGATLSPSIANALIDAASKSKNSSEFMAIEALTVLYWLAETKFRPDSNQTKQGWPWLLTKSKAWQEAETQRSILTNQVWDCRMKTISLLGYKFVPLVNAWEVRQEAVLYRHCADDYIGQCKDGFYRLFSVLDSDGNHKATAGYIHNDDNWSLNQIKGFANREVSKELAKLAESISAGMDIVFEGKADRDLVLIESEQQCSIDDDKTDQCDEDVDTLEELLHEVDAEECFEVTGCLICGSHDNDCDHLVACYEYGCEILGGEAFKMLNQWIGCIRELFNHCVENDIHETGLGLDADGLLSNIYKESCYEDDTLEEIMPAYDDQYRYNSLICSMIADDNDIYVGDRELVDGMPGMSAYYTNYWAKTPSSVIERISNQIEDALNRFSKRKENDLNEISEVLNSMLNDPNSQLNYAIKTTGKVNCLSCFIPAEFKD